MSKNNNSYEVEVIVKKCDNIEDKVQFIDYLSNILQEKKKDILYRLYAHTKKDFLIKILENTLTIMNSGGLNKIDDNQNKRSIGGTFYYLVKKSELLNQDLIKKIFWQNNKKKKMIRKLYKSFNELNISNEKEKNNLKK